MLRVAGIPTAEAEHFRSGGVDANGQAPVVRAAHGVANPCRHCLGLIAEGEPMLILAYRPFDPPAQPYAETGPIFLHQRACARYEGDALPAWFKFLDPAAIRGYGADGWIRYETGQIVRGGELTAASASILSNAEIAYVHIRSKFGCFQCRVDRA
ncbi:MAG TPA: DUF1203 domain-containing protein [Terricaulis sp.]|nr:DUF1203 domain-containing protein [Terricaulis sp.]